MGEGFLSQEPIQFQGWQIQCSITNTCQVSIPHHPPLICPLLSSAEPHYDRL